MKTRDGLQTTGKLSAAPVNTVRCKIMNVYWNPYYFLLEDPLKTSPIRCSVKKKHSKLPIIFFTPHKIKKYNEYFKIMFNWHASKTKESIEFSLYKYVYICMDVTKSTQKPHLNKKPQDSTSKPLWTFCVLNIFMAFKQMHSHLYVYWVIPTSGMIFCLLSLYFLPNQLVNYFFQRTLLLFTMHNTY